MVPVREKCVSSGMEGLAFNLDICPYIWPLTSTFLKATAFARSKI